MFQYKVIYNVLTTRTTLYRDDLMDDATCNLCFPTEQTLTHLLINCVTLAEFWTSFQNVWYEKTSGLINYVEATYFTAGSTGQNIGRYLTIAYTLIAKYSFLLHKPPWR